MKKKRIKDKNSLSCKKIWLIIGATFISLIWISIFVLFRFAFFRDDLSITNSDWLAFSGTFLGTTATVFLSVVALYQSKQISKFEKERREQERHSAIQPIFSVQLKGKNKNPSSLGEIVGVDYRHKNIEIQVTNYSDFLIKNIFLCTTFAADCIVPREPKTFFLALSGSNDLKNYPGKLIEIDGAVETDEDGIPKRIDITYEDIDGEVSAQAFMLMTLDGKTFFKLSETYRV